MLSSPSRFSTSAPGDSSRTITVSDALPLPESSDVEPARPSLPQGTLRLRGGPRSRPRVTWDERVVDNENCGRKKSKICCIYHKPKEFDESSDESSSDEDSDSEDGRARPPHHHHHEHDHHHLDGSVDRSGGEGGLRSASEGGVMCKVEAGNDYNAYESQPRKGKTA